MTAQRRPKPNPLRRSAPYRRLAEIKWVLRKRRFRQQYSRKTRHMLLNARWKAATLLAPASVSTRTKPRKEPLIVSLTSIPSRIHHVDKTIKSILLGTVRPDRIVLWLSEHHKTDRFPDLPRSALPRSLTQLERNGLEIRYTEDIAACRKLVPALKAFPDAAVITIDDDYIYPRSTVEQLYSAYMKHGARHIYCRASREIGRKGNGQLFHGRQFRNPAEGSMQYYGIGYGGILYPPQCMHPDLPRKDIYAQLDDYPFAEDFVFYSMAALNGVAPIQVRTGAEGESALPTQSTDDLLALHGGDQGRMAKHHAIAQKVIKLYGQDPVTAHRKDG